MNSLKISKLIEQRYSPRSYSSKKLTEDTILKLFEATRWAASSRNTQPWRFIYATPENIVMWNKLFDCLIEFNQEWVKTAQFLMLALVQKVDPFKNEERSNTGYQLGLAMGNFTAQANELGVFLRSMGGFSKQKAMVNFDIPQIYEPVIMVAAGYPGDENNISDEFKVPKGSNRKRRALNEIIFEGDWDKMQ